MIFNNHTNLTGQHARLSPSNYHWINYDDDKFDRMFVTQEAARRGTELHDYAAKAIRLRRKQPRTKDTVNMYINDCIGWGMTPELVLYYSRNCFGTADACSFRVNKLRISDLKTGLALTSIIQLEIYAALFCWEYKFSPFEIDTELRLYQNNEIRLTIADPDRIVHHMDRIKARDRRIEELRWEDDA